MTSKLKPAPLHSLKVTSFQIPRYGYIPNTSIQGKPLLIYHSAFSPEDTSAAALEGHVNEIGVVKPAWRYTMSSKSHFHSTTHEVLCIASGRAVCCFGHENNPDRIEAELAKGDVVIIPAGVSHRLQKDIEGNFSMVGCYPMRKTWDMCYGREDEQEKIETIANLGWFDCDPIYGNQGPALQI